MLYIIRLRVKIPVKHYAQNLDSNFSHDNSTTNTSVALRVFRDAISTNKTELHTEFRGGGFFGTKTVKVCTLLNV